MNVKEFREFAVNFFEACKVIVKKKNADYTGTEQNGSAFSNIQAVENFHIPATHGLITRMSDKLARISSFMKNGKLLVQDENVIDTIRDMANYSCLFSGLVQSSQEMLPMDHIQYTHFAESFFNVCIEAIKEKSQELGEKDDDDAFKNSMTVQHFHVPAAHGFITRMSDVMTILSCYVKREMIFEKSKTYSGLFTNLACFSCELAAFIDTTIKSSNIAIGAGGSSGKAVSIAGVHL